MERTGLTVDPSYMSKILKREKKAARIVKCICEVLGIDEATV